jgi:hypothetical protein
MSGYDAGTGGGSMMVRPRTSGTAITGFVLGLLLCVPLVTGLGAIVFSAVGMRATRQPLVRGRGMAIAGLILGIVSVLLWIVALAVGGGIGVFTWSIFSASSAPRAVLVDFAGHVAAWDIPAAQAECDPSITATDLDDLHTKLAAMGTYTGITSTSVFMSAGTGKSTTCTLRGIAQFSSGAHLFDAVLVKDASGTWKVTSFHVK